MGVVDAITAGAGAVGGLFDIGEKTGNNTYRQSDYTDTDKYNKGAFTLGGSDEAYQQELARQGNKGFQMENRGSITGDYSNADQTRGQEMNALGMAHDAALGLGTSVAQQQQQQGIEAAQRQQLATAGGARGAGALGLGSYGAASNMGQLAAQGVAQNSMLRAQEIAQARGQYLGGASGIRGQDIGQAGDIANQRLQSRAQNDQAQQYFEGLRQQNLMNNYQGQQDRERFQAGTHQAADQGNAGINQQNANNQWKLSNGLKGGIQGGMQYGAMSGGGGQAPPSNGMG